jgi:hypothetical protein
MEGCPLADQARVSKHVKNWLLLHFFCLLFDLSITPELESRNHTNPAHAARIIRRAFLRFVVPSHAIWMAWHYGLGFGGGG